MRVHMLAAALIAAVAMAAPAEAASKKRKKAVHRETPSVVQSKAHPHDVNVGGEWVGRDPDPFIRSMMMRNPQGWDGPQ
jgi:hypothetical protein